MNSMRSLRLIAMTLAVFAAGNPTSVTAASAAEVQRLAQQRAEAQRRTQAEAQQRAQAEAQRKAQADAQQRAEVQRKTQAEAQQKAQAEAQRKAQADAQQRAEAQRKTQAETQQKAQAEAQRKAQADAQQRAEAQRKTHAEAQQRAESQRKAQAEAQQKAQAEAQRKAQAAAQQRAEAQRKTQAEAQQRAESQRKAQAEAQQRAQAQAQQKAQADAQRKVQVEAQQRAQAEAQRRAQTDAQRKAQSAATPKAREPSPTRATVGGFLAEGKETAAGVANVVIHPVKTVSATAGAVKNGTVDAYKNAGGGKEGLKAVGKNVVALAQTMNPLNDVKDAAIAVKKHDYQQLGKEAFSVATFALAFVAPEAKLAKTAADAEKIAAEAAKTARALEKALPTRVAEGGVEKVAPGAGRNVLYEFGKPGQDVTPRYVNVAERSDGAKSIVYGNEKDPLKNKIMKDSPHGHSVIKKDPSGQEEIVYARTIRGTVLVDKKEFLSGK